MADKNLEILITAKDEASKSFQELDKQLDSTTKTTKELTKATDSATKEQKENKEVVDKSGNSYETLEDKVSKYIKTAISVGAVIGVAKEVVDISKQGIQAYADSEKELAGVWNTVKNMSESTLETIGGSFEEAQAKISEFGATMQAKSGFGDEELSKGVVRLTQTVRDFTKAKELMSTAMDLARYKGIDLETSVLAIQKAYNGSTSELVKLGIEVDKNATAEENLAKITDITRGSYEAYGQSLAGQTDIMDQSIGDMYENIGKALLPIVNKLVDVVNKYVIPAVNFMIEKVGDFITKCKESETLQAIFTLLREVFEHLWGAIMELWESVQPFLPFIKSIAEFIGAVLVGTIVAVIEVITGVIRVIAGWLNSWKEIFHYVKEFLIKLFTGDFAGALDALKGAIIAWAKGVIKPFETLYDWVKKCIDAVGGLISKLLGLNKTQQQTNVDPALMSGQSVGAGVNSGSSSAVYTAGKAIGGSVYSGNSYLVGEHGREIFTPSSNGYITPSSKLGGNNIVINITGNQLLDEDAGEKIGNMILSKLQNQANLA